MELDVGRLRRDGLPSVHTVHVEATLRSEPPPSRKLRASWTFIVADKPLNVTVRCVRQPTANSHCPTPHNSAVALSHEWQLSGTTATTAARRKIRTLLQQLNYYNIQRHN